MIEVPDTSLIALALGAFLSLVAEWWPWLRLKMDKLSPGRKATAMALLTGLATVAITALACTRGLTIFGLSCPETTLDVFALNVFYALVANQVTHLLAKDRSEKDAS